MARPANNTERATETGRSVEAARLLWEQKTGSSNLPVPTTHAGQAPGNAENVPRAQTSGTSPARTSRDQRTKRHSNWACHGTTAAPGQGDRQPGRPHKGAARLQGRRRPCPNHMRPVRTRSPLPLTTPSTAVDERSSPAEVLAAPATGSRRQTRRASQLTRSPMGLSAERPSPGGRHRNSGSRSIGTRHTTECRQIGCRLLRSKKAQRTQEVRLFPFRRSTKPPWLNGSATGS